MLTASFVLLSLALGASATDYLVSSAASSARLDKRGLLDNGNYNITVYHTNDIHAHLSEFTSSGTDCVDPTKGCYGGYARIKEVVDDERAKTPDSVFLDIGDQFQGTLFYTFYRGEKIAETINQLGYDAMTLGNHEFDGGDDELGAFVKNVTFPVICANIQTDQKELNATIKPYTIIEKHQLAIIGVTTDTIPDISSPGPNTKFSDPIASVQATIDSIKATETNVTRFIAITHIGYDQDKLLAQKTKGLHLIVGGHSHTLLGDMDKAEGKYPTIEKNADGDDVFIVTAYRWGEYLGKIDVAFTPEGKIAAYTGGPIHLTNETAQDQELEAQIEEWRKPFEEFGAEVVGHSDVVLDQTACKKSECLLGDVMADAIVDYRSGSVVGAIINGGGVRATIDAGPVTRGEVMTAFPFANVIVEIDYTGDELWKIFEGIFSEASQFNDRAVIPGVQVSKEFKITYNPTNNNGSRLISLKLGGEDVDFKKTYKIGTIDFLAKGGDNQMPAADPATLTTLDAMDEVLTRYINKTSPINAALDGRISTTEVKSTDAANTLTVGAFVSLAAILSTAFALLL